MHLICEQGSIILLPPPSPLLRGGRNQLKEEGEKGKVEEKGMKRGKKAYKERKKKSNTPLVSEKKAWSVTLLCKSCD